MRRGGVGPGLSFTRGRAQVVSASGIASTRAAWRAQWAGRWRRGRDAQLCFAVGRLQHHRQPPVRQHSGGRATPPSRPARPEGHRQAGQGVRRACRELHLGDRAAPVAAALLSASSPSRRARSAAESQRRGRRWCARCSRPWSPHPAAPKRSISWRRTSSAKSRPGHRPSGRRNGETAIGCALASAAWAALIARSSADALDHPVPPRPAGLGEAERVVVVRRLGAGRPRNAASGRVSSSSALLK